MIEIEITKDNFQEEVINSSIPVLVDFWAAWCAPCGMVAPIVAEIAEELKGKLKVCKVNIDDNEELAVQYRITGIPTLMLFKDGVVKNTIIGVRSKQELIVPIVEVL